jgi:hypothetical protein
MVHYRGHKTPLPRRQEEAISSPELLSSSFPLSLFFAITLFRLHRLLNYPFSSFPGIYLHLSLLYFFVFLFFLSSGFERARSPIWGAGIATGWTAERSELDSR